MGSKKIDATEWSCDSEACDSTELVSGPDQTSPPQPWISGTVVDSTNTPLPWVACKKGCIVKAVSDALTMGAVERVPAQPVPSQEGAQ